jgi:hypothetical protein
MNNSHGFVQCFIAWINFLQDFINVKARGGVTLQDDLGETSWLALRKTRHADTMTSLGYLWNEGTTVQ